MNENYHNRDPLTLRESFIYLIIAIGSLLMISYLPHMLLDGLIEDETKVNIQIGITIFWAIGLGFLGRDIYVRRNCQ